MRKKEPLEIRTINCYYHTMNERLKERDGMKT